MQIRTEEKRDWPVVKAINEAAFEGPGEARLVETLRTRVPTAISLVAEDDDGTVVGHIMFSPVTLSKNEGLNLMGLAPMAVTPERQRQGIGTALVEAGLEACREAGVGAVFVLGYPEYYPRFGFTPAADRGIDCEYEAPPGAFMALELAPDYLDGAEGIIWFHPAFGDL